MKKMGGIPLVTTNHIIVTFVTLVPRFCLPISEIDQVKGARTAVGDAAAAAVLDVALLTSA